MSQYPETWVDPSRGCDEENHEENHEENQKNASKTPENANIAGSNADVIPQTEENEKRQKDQDRLLVGMTCLFRVGITELVKKMK